MAWQPMQGVKVLEVAQFTFTPAAGGVLAEWGADVIKVEHPVTGDAQRALAIGAGGTAAGSFQPLMDHPNRGKRSIGLALDAPRGHEILLELAREADVFITNFLPAARRRLHIEVDDIRAANPDIIYVRGSGYGQRGAEAERPGYDGSTFWSRMGSAWGATSPDSPRLAGQPAGAYGDSMGGAMMAGGIAAALFARARTGETSIIDVSLMGVGAWATALWLGTAMLSGEAPAPARLDSPSFLPVNPMVGHFRTADGRFITLLLLQPSKYFADLCKHIGLEHLLDDERFETDQGIVANTKEIGEQVTAAIAAKPYAYWVEQLQTLQGPWAPAQSPGEIVADPQLAANGYLLPIVDADGIDRQLVANPVQFDERPPTGVRGPLLAEHTDAILRDLGKSAEEVEQLRMAGICR
jgi:crotonobetainyl-CoA:carnitine CoA-transferase CaiB-like acyl-CoA transferase